MDTFERVFTPSTHKWQWLYAAPALSSQRIVKQPASRMEDLSGK